MTTAETDAAENARPDGVPDSGRMAVDSGTLSSVSAIEENGVLAGEGKFPDARVARSRKRTLFGERRSVSSRRQGMSKVSIVTAVLGTILVSLVAIRFIQCLATLRPRIAVRGGLSSGVTPRQLAGGPEEDTENGSLPGLGNCMEAPGLVDSESSPDMTGPEPSESPGAGDEEPGLPSVDEEGTGLPRAEDEEEGPVPPGDEQTELSSAGGEQTALPSAGQEERDPTPAGDEEGSTLLLPAGAESEGDGGVPKNQAVRRRPPGPTRAELLKSEMRFRRHRRRVLMAILLSALALLLAATSCATIAGVDRLQPTSQQNAAKQVAGKIGYGLMGLGLAVLFGAFSYWWQKWDPDRAPGYDRSPNV